MSMGAALNDYLNRMKPDSEADSRLDLNVTIRQAVAAKLLDGASLTSDPKMLNLGLKALNDSDKVTLTRQRNQQDKETAQSANEIATNVYRELVARHGKSCIAEEDTPQKDVLPIDQRTEVELDSTEFELMEEEAIVGLDTADAMMDGKEE